MWHVLRDSLQALALGAPWSYSLEAVWLRLGVGVAEETVRVTPQYHNIPDIKYCERSRMHHEKMVKSKMSWEYEQYKGK